MVWLTDDIETDCNNMNHINGCILDIGIISSNPFAYTEKGCNVLTHEWFHLMGYEENEIPLCKQSQEFR